MLTYYNEHDPFAVAWLARLIEAGEISGGCVDERDIQAVQPDDVRGYERAHFFAGIAGWDLALRLAGWPDDGRVVWTGSCPCQPFSSAGKRAGIGDERHLWPAWLRLIEQCRPDVIFGEQVASSMVVGDSDETVQSVRRDKAYRELRETLTQQRWPTLGLLFVPERIGEEESSTLRLEDRGAAETVPDAPASPVSDRECEEASQGQGDSFRPRSSGASGQDRRRALRTDGRQVRPIGTTSAVGAASERSITRQNRRQQRLHDGQRQGYLLGGEHGDVLLGRSSVPEDSAAVGGAARLDDTRECTAPGEAEREAAPATVWLDAVFADLERIGYSCAAADIPAAGVGAPHIRQRLYWVAQSWGSERRPGGAGSGGTNRSGPYAELTEPSDTRVLAHTGRGGIQRTRPALDRASSGATEAQDQRQRLRPDAGDGRDARRLVHTEGERCGEGRGGGGRPSQRSSGPITTSGLGNATSGGLGADGRAPRDGGHADEGGPAEGAAFGAHGGPWSDARPLLCRDGKVRVVPTEPALFPLAPTGSVRNRVGTLRGSGNAISPWQAAAFVRASMEIVP